MSTNDLVRDHAQRLKRIVARQKAGKPISPADRAFLQRDQPDEGLVYDSLQSAANGLDIPLPDLKRLKREGGPAAGFRGSRVYANPLQAWLRTRAPRANAGQPTKDTLECDFLQVRIARQQLQFDAERDLLLDKAAIEQWLTDRIAQITDLLDNFFNVELPKCEGLRAPELLAKGKTLRLTLCRQLQALRVTSSTHHGKTPATHAENPHHQPPPDKGRAL